MIKDPTSKYCVPPFYKYALLVPNYIADSNKPPLQTVKPVPIVVLTNFLQHFKAVQNNNKH